MSYSINKWILITLAALAVGNFSMTVLSKVGVDVWPTRIASIAIVAVAATLATMTYPKRSH